MSDREAARSRLAELVATADPASRDRLADQPRLRALLAAVADHSPFLWHLIAGDWPRALALLNDEPLASQARLLRAIAAVEETSDAALMHRLRRIRQEIALLVALCDLGAVWSLEEVMQALSDAAEAFIRATLRHLLRAAARAGRLSLGDPADPERGCGLAVLALGKLGGRELNYSSDVDLIVLFDRAAPAVGDTDGAATLYVRLVRDLVKLLQQPTADGFVLRVDLRLRPDPGSTGVAVGHDAALRYYESVGQTWERAAMIKARPVAGDRGLAQDFLGELAPFVWRKYFDYAAIADIHAMKRQIHVAKGHGAIAVAGHDVKIGRGGIREIEFFVQTQQLIFGGKRPALRGSRTRPALRRLRREGWIGAHAAADLARAYDLLRRIEHRLQMLADAQTHRLPSTVGELERFAQFCGFASAERFSVVLERHLRAVEHHYGRLFESTASDAHALVFTGVDDDPATLQALAAMGYRSPAGVIRLVREWHVARGLSARSREALTDLVPKLLETFAAVLDPDGAVSAFDAALVRMPPAAELFALLNGNAALRALFGDIVGSAPRLAGALTLHPHLLDGAIDASNVVSCDESVMEARAVAALARCRTTEEALDAIRDFQHGEHFLIGVALLSGQLDAERAGLAYSALVVAVVRALLARARAAFAQDHGDVPAAELAILALGKLGSREMTATSDLDLVLLYTFDPERDVSDGPRPLHAVQYFTRLTQRLVAGLTVATRRGRLYEVDMRLRPSGRQGPLATKLAAFALYQRDEAQTWEHMALTRARIVAGDPACRATAAAVIADVLRSPPPARLADDVVAMRAKIEAEKPARGPWDLKLLPGGLVDVEFVAQYLVLRHAAAHPDLLVTSTAAMLTQAGACGVVPVETAHRLVAAHRLFTSTLQIMRLALDEERTPEEAAPGVRGRIAAAAGAPDLTRLAAEIAAARQAVRETFLAVLSP